MRARPRRRLPRDRSFGRSWAVRAHVTLIVGPRMDLLTLFGLVGVTAMLVFYMLEDRSPWFILAFGGACVLGAAYGFLQGAWPFGLVEAIWAGVAIRRWRVRIHESPLA